MLTIKLGDIVRAVAVAILTGAWIAIAGLFVQDFDVFTADWASIGKLAVNGGFFSLAGYITKNLLTAENGRIFGVL